VLGWTNILRGYKNKTEDVDVKSVLTEQGGEKGRERTHQFLLKNQIANLTFPAYNRLSKIRVEFPGTCGICGALAHLELDQELAGCFPTLR
jgi:hypothetical protein